MARTDQTFVRVVLLVRQGEARGYIEGDIVFPEESCSRCGKPICWVGDPDAMPGESWMVPTDLEPGFAGELTAHWFTCEGHR